MTYLFSPPTHEEPFTDEPWVRYFRLTHALSVAKIDGTWKSLHAASIPEATLSTLTLGTTFFRGGEIYFIDNDVAADLAAAGYPVQAVGEPTGYGMGAYGTGRYGF